eukprot:1698364-Amphidinium_carterae.1
MPLRGMLLQRYVATEAAKRPPLPHLHLLLAPPLQELRLNTWTESKNTEGPFSTLSRTVSTLYSKLSDLAKCHVGEELVDATCWLAFAARSVRMWMAWIFVVGFGGVALQRCGGSMWLAECTIMEVGHPVSLAHMQVLCHTLQQNCSGKRRRIQEKC